MNTMRKLLNLVLIVALGAGAFLSRPDQKQFADFLAAKSAANDTSVLKGSWDEASARDYADKCTFLNRIFWTTVKHNEDVVYVGAFSHWFNKAEIKRDIANAQDKATAELNSLNNTKNQLENLKDKVSH